MRKTPFTFNYNRKKASNNGKCLTMTFGRTGLSSRSWDSAKNKRFPELHKSLIKLADTLDPGFVFTSITVNKNFQTYPHYDSNNVGNSMIIALGDYKGGNLNIEGTSTDINN